MVRGDDLKAATDIDGHGRVDDSAFVDRLLADGGMPRWSEVYGGRLGRPMCARPLVWDCGPPGPAQRSRR